MIPHMIVVENEHRHSFYQHIQPVFMCRIVYIEAFCSVPQRLESPLHIISSLSAHDFVSGSQTQLCECVSRFAVCYHNIWFSNDSCELLKEQESCKTTSWICNLQHHDPASFWLDSGSNIYLTGTKFHFCFANNDDRCRSGETAD